MKYSQNTLDDIRSRLDLVELVGQYVQLKKSGQNFTGLCPFHKEKSGSFTVHPLKQIYKCFGCQKSGNIYTFLMDYEGVSFPEAVQRLAKKAGVELVEDPQFLKRNPAVSASQKRMIEIHTLAAKFYHYLLTEKKEYKAALDYIQGRGITRKTIDQFMIGVSPPGWSSFIELAGKRGFKLPELISSGLVIEKDGGKAGYDRFRNRLMFPITNKEGAVIAFGARILEEEEGQPKYINSSESPIFSKRKNLYGLFENQRGIRLQNEAVVVEGYMDVVGLHQAGVTNAVAAMGTALTEEHLRELKALTKNIVTVFDSDKAGIDAWHRSVHLCLEAGFFAKDLSLPEGLDPDEFVLKEGPEAFYELCRKAPRQITKFLKEIAQKGALTPQETAKHLEELTPIIYATRNLPDRLQLWDDIAMVLKVSQNALKELSQKSAEKQPKPEPQRPRLPSTLKTKEVTNVLDHEFLFACVRWPLEFLKLSREDWFGVLKDPHLNDWLLELSQSTDKADFERRVESLVHREPQSALSSTATSALFEEKETPDSTIPSFGAVFDRVRLKKKEFEIKALTTQIKLSQRSGDETEQLRLIEKLRSLRST